MTLTVTGSVTYLAASNFSDNSWIEENTRRGSLKPHAKAESFRGLLNFSVFRQNCHVTGSPETFQFIDEQCPWYIFFTEPLFLIPSVQAEDPGVRPHQLVQSSFRRNQFSSCPPGRAR